MAMRGAVERPSGLVYRRGLIDSQEESELLARFATIEMAPVVMHEVASRREVKHYGLRYDFDAWSTAPAEPIPGYLLQLDARAGEVAGVDPSKFAEALVTWYPPGATIGWHRDASAFGPVVVGVSLGSETVMRFQRRAAGGERRVFEQPLARRSAYVLAGAARSVWQHSLPAVAQERWSVTFRQLRSRD
jgi:DNA oxidative demethylase